MLNYAYCSDKYQYTMGKSFYDSGMKDQHAVFNMFYRNSRRRSLVMLMLFDSVLTIRLVR